MARSRFNIYRYAHKCLRLSLAQLLERAVSTDFRSPDELSRLSAEAALTLRLIRSHAQHEDTFLAPLLQLYCPELASAVADEHSHQAQALDALERLLTSTDPLRADASLRGHDFNLGLARVLGELLVHMSEEEQRVLPALWQRVSDKTLQSVSESLLAHMAQDDHALWLRTMLRALNRRERLGLLGRMRASMPAPAFKAAVDSVRAELKSMHGSVSSELRLLEGVAA